MYTLAVCRSINEYAVALMQDSHLVVAAIEDLKDLNENLPEKAVLHCLKSQGIQLKNIDTVLIGVYGALKKNIIRTEFFNRYLEKRRWSEFFRAHEVEPQSIRFSDLNLSMAAGTFYPSPFMDAAVLNLGSEDPESSLSLWMGHEHQLFNEWIQVWPHRLDVLIDRFSQFCGFYHSSGQARFLQMASYGEPRFVDLLQDEIINLKTNGQFTVSEDYMLADAGVDDPLGLLFSGPARNPSDPVSVRELDIACSFSCLLDEIVKRWSDVISKDLGSENLCLSGGVVWMDKLKTSFEKMSSIHQVWSAPSNEAFNLARGAALYHYHQILGHPRILAPQPFLSTAKVVRIETGRQPVLETI